MSDTILRVEHLSVDYKIKAGWLSAVNDVSFSIDRGKVLALVGESGCGKSTVAHTIMRLSIDHNERIGGNIFFEDRDLTKISEAEMEKVRGKHIGMIFQNPLDSLNPVYRSGTQVAEALRLDGMSKREARERVIQLYRDVQIPNPEERIEAFPHELSGGMRQRVMIAMMLARHPQLLIADEPTTALDVTVEAQVLNIMKEMCDKENASVLLITHNFGIVAEIADRIGIMYAGELVEEGEVHEIFRNPVHPYSQALLAALPKIKKSEGTIRTIEGTVPRILEKKPECRFANRCPYADETCRCSSPEAKFIEDGHMVRCHKR
ncbi:MAG: ABC transporter ATP-binding protein [Firmicutes bacterium]|nr:ABC transporter ATP-binding protein [Bacillota bacterium]MBQ6294802.1 ABC transporter ATP-binding protein [Bacillota bacterium]